MFNDSADTQDVPVWDFLLRLLHWWNAVFLLAQIGSGSFVMLQRENLPETSFQTLVDIHSATGYALAAGIFTRIIWLFIGPQTAHWKDLLPLKAYQRAELVDTLKFYLTGLRGDGPLYFAHNALAGLIYLGFFIVALTQVVSGAILLETLADERKGSDLLEFHEIGFFLLGAFVVAHLVAVVVHEIVEDRGLIRAMLFGHKRFTDVEIKAIKNNHNIEEE